MIRIVYSLLIYLYRIAFSIVGFLKTKAKRRIDGLKNQVVNDKDNNPKILVHCASAGEFEQAMPIIDWILVNTKYSVVLTFFSSSGYEYAQSNHHRIHKYYLPFDLTSEMNPFLDLVNPEKVILVKNEWWWNLIGILKTKKIPVYLVSSTIRDNHYFIKYPFSFFKNRIATFSKAFVLNQQSKKNLAIIFTGPIQVMGDTRIDQVIKNKSRAGQLIVKGQNKIIYGSIWKHDIPYIKGLIELFPDHQHILFPHELSEKSLETISTHFPKATINNDLSQIEHSNVIIINQMGVLKLAYKLGSIAYVGGGFGVGIHNILEPAVFGIPILFGPNNHKSIEAQEFKKIKCAFEIQQEGDLQIIQKKLSKENKLDQIRANLDLFFKTNQNAAEKICLSIFTAS